MRVLLFNDNPVVTKLVTLSAQKTGDELEVCSDIESLGSSEVDLLIVDDGLYNDESAITLGVSVTASQHLFMANRGSSKPEGFEHTINKPFLPTDLVELFTMISNSLESTSDDSIDDELTLDMEEIEDEIDLKIDDDLDTLDDLGALDLDGIEAESDALMDFDLEDKIETDDSENLTLEEETQESVLDKDDLAEVQSLLEDEDETAEDDISIGSLEDLDDLGLEIDDEILENSEEEEISELEEISLDEEELSDLNLEEVTESELEDTAAEEMQEELSLDDIDEEELADLDFEEVAESELEDIADEEIQEEEFSLDDDALNNLEDEIQSAISELSDEELEASVDEDILLDIVSSDETLATFSGLDDLDEQSLKVAVGEAEASDIIEDITENNENSLNSDDIDITEKSTKIEGVEALKTLLKALENDDVVNSLNGMNININISFGGDN